MEGASSGSWVAERGAGLEREEKAKARGMSLGVDGSG